MKNHEDIRIGTLVNGNANAAGYIQQILPHGFESFSLTFWQTINVDVKKVAAEVKEALGDSGAVISSISMFGNPLEKGEIDVKTLKGWRTLIDNAHLFGTDLVTGFSGRLRGKSIPDSMPRYTDVFGPLGRRAADKGVRLAFENCCMGGSWMHGDWNIAHTPDAWELMFNAIPSENIGLQWEPCHQMVKLIDPMPQIRKWGKKMFHVHGKDASVYWNVVREHGITGPVPFCHHRTPGFGDSNWTAIISELRQVGFKGSIDIEGWHDPIYRGDMEMTGQVHGLNYLKNCRGGAYVQNPNV
jgi:sugar phosphate isomerase/epimerase